MTSDRRLIDRRAFVAGGLAGAGLLIPGAALAQKRRRAAAVSAAFTHGVASGEPGQTSMLFWTRYQGTPGRAVPLELEISTDPNMARGKIMAEGYADPARDWTARASVTGLIPGKVYYYRWIAPGKDKRSIIGRTRTLPQGAVPQFRMGVFSCSNLPLGWFNAYAHAVANDDIDLVVHLGDYIYAEPRGTALAGRLIEPAGEAITREDHWARYRSYRADPDLQALHAQFAGLFLLDSNDISAEPWRHDPARIQSALAARQDWLPISDAAWAGYEIGRLATLYRLDTRISGRDPALDLVGAVGRGPDPRTALKRLKDQDWVAGSRQILGFEQERWLFDEMKRAGSTGIRWQILAQQLVMGRIIAPPGLSGFAGRDANFASFLGAAEAAAPFGLPMNMESWDGYPAARARLLSMGQRANVDLVVLSGNSHNAWANDLWADDRVAGVEFAGPSVTSPGIESRLAAGRADELSQALIRANPGLRWADTSGRGYMHVSLSTMEARCQWRFTEAVSARSLKLASVMNERVAVGQRRLVMG